jgi:uncharacterized protein
MKIIHIIAWILLIVGGLNWGLVGAFQLNLVNAIFGGVPMLESIIYILVGVAAIYELVMHRKMCKMCSSSAADAPKM